MDSRKSLRQTMGIVSLLLLLVACSTPGSMPPSTPPTISTAPTSPPPTATLVPTGIPTPTSPPTQEPRADGLSHEEAATLNSLQQVDDFPLYTMHYYGTYRQKASIVEKAEGLTRADLAATPPSWGCSLFAALGNANQRLYGRNFDWEYSPAVLLFTDPPDGYASVSMVDIAYLGFKETRASTLTDLPLAERQGLLAAPFMPFDGMNERGLVVGMAAVPPGQMRPDPNKETTDSIMVIREMLDDASTVDEAVAILESYNIDMGGGPPIHYLIADPSGRAALVEFYQGEMVVIPNETPWHLATNFLRASVGESATGECWRYDEIYRQLVEAEGKLTAQDAMDLLAQVSGLQTRWSAVYRMSTGDIDVTMGQQYNTVHAFHLDLANEQPSSQYQGGDASIDTSSGHKVGPDRPSVR